MTNLIWELKGCEQIKFYIVNVVSSKVSNSSDKWMIGWVKRQSYPHFFLPDPWNVFKTHTKDQRPKTQTCENEDFVDQYQYLGNCPPIKVQT